MSKKTEHQLTLFVYHECRSTPSGQECRTGMYPKIKIYKGPDNTCQPSGDIAHQSP